MSKNIHPNPNTQVKSDIGATPTLKVMRLQSPSLGQPSAGSLGGSFALNSALRLPDSFGVIHVGETFTAYLGALNTSPTTPVYNLNVKAALQTPSTRYLLSSTLDNSISNSNIDNDNDPNNDTVLENEGGFTIPPSEHLSSIVSRTLEEVGAHVLRVEVRYSQNKSIRKYYRFNVSSPLSIRELTVRGGDNRCFVSIAIENVTQSSSIIIDSAKFHPPPGLTATQVGTSTPPDNSNAQQLNTAAAQKYDSTGHLSPGTMFRYLFLVQVSSENAKNAKNTENAESAENTENTTIRSIAHKDELGKAVFSWKKIMGEKGQLASMSVLCPPSFPHHFLTNDKREFHANTNKLVIHGSGLSVDVAADSEKPKSENTSSTLLGKPKPSLSVLLPVTVEPINPPKLMILAQPQSVKLLIINHSPKPLNLQLQFRLHLMSGAVICGESFKNLGVLSEKGGRTIIQVQILALVAGLFRCQGCVIVDLDTGLEVPMMTLFSIYVCKNKQNKIVDTFTASQHQLEQSQEIPIK